MYYIENKEIILTQYKEINSNDNVNDYSHIKQLLIDRNCVRHCNFNENTVIIFEVFETYDGKEWVDNELFWGVDEDYDVYEKILCLCTMEVMYDTDEVHTVWSEQSYADQFEKIIEKYGSEYKIQEDDIEKIPFIMCDGQEIKYTIVPVLVDQYIGTEKELEEELEEESV